MQQSMRNFIKYSIIKTEPYFCKVIKNNKYYCKFTDDIHKYFSIKIHDNHHSLIRGLLDGDCCVPRFHNFDDNELFDKVKEYALKYDGSLIKHIKKQTPKYQEIAIVSSCKCLNDIENPSEELQELIIEEHGKYCVEYYVNHTDNNKYIKKYTCEKIIRNSSDKIKKMALKANAHNIMFMDNPNEAYIFEPCEKAQEIAVRENEFLIKHIKNPSENVQRIAIMNSGDVFKYIDNPSIKIMLFALEYRSSSFKYFKNPSEEMKQIAVEKDPNNIQHIENPSDELIETAIRGDGNCIHYIRNPSEKMKMLAVKTSPNAIQYIDDPCEKIIIHCLLNKKYLGKGEKYKLALDIIKFAEK